MTGSVPLELFAPPMEDIPDVPEVPKEVEKPVISNVEPAREEVKPVQTQLNNLSRK